MTYKMTVKKAENLEPEYFVFTPQHGTGVLLVHEIVEIEAIDWGNHIEITTEDERKHVVNADDRVLVVFQLKGGGRKTKKQSIIVEEGMDRLASFIKDNHGSQDWENTVYNLLDYLAIFILSSGKEVYEDLMKRMAEKG